MVIKGLVVLYPQWNYWCLVGNGWVAGGSWWHSPIPYVQHQKQVVLKRLTFCSPTQRNILIHPNPTSANKCRCWKAWSSSTKHKNWFKHGFSASHFGVPQNMHPSLGVVRVVTTCRFFRCGYPIETWKTSPFLHQIFPWKASIHRGSSAETLWESWHLEVVIAGHLDTWIPMVFHGELCYRVMGKLRNSPYFLNVILVS